MKLRKGSCNYGVFISFCSLMKRAQRQIVGEDNNFERGTQQLFVSYPILNTQV